MIRFFFDYVCCWYLDFCDHHLPSQQRNIAQQCASAGDKKRRNIKRRNCSMPTLVFFIFLNFCPLRRNIKRRNWSVPTQNDKLFRFCIRVITTTISFPKKLPHRVVKCVNFVHCKNVGIFLENTLATKLIWLSHLHQLCKFIYGGLPQRHSGALPEKVSKELREVYLS